MDNITDTPAELMFRNFDPELRKVIHELGIKYVEWDQACLKFAHKGYSFELRIKQIKSLES